MSDTTYNKLNWLSRILLPKLTTFFGVVSGVFIGYGIDKVGMWLAIAAAVMGALDTLISEIVQANSNKFFADKTVVELTDPILPLAENEVVG